MATKQVECMNPVSCLNSATPDEPIFVLRGNDRNAAATVRMWASLYFAEKDGLEKMTHRQRAKYYEALAMADALEEWQFMKVSTMAEILGVKKQ